jgi:hypothetical protein
MVKNGLSTPFSCGVGHAPNPHAKGNNGTYDRNTTPLLSKPHDVGKDGVKEIFFADIPGKPMPVSTPMAKTLAQGTFAVYKEK